MRNLSSNKLFLMSFDLHCYGKKSLHSHLMNMWEYFKPDLFDIAMVKIYASSMKQEYISYGKPPFNILKNMNFIDLLKPIIPPLVTST